MKKNNSLVLNAKILKPNIVLPNKAHYSDAGFDVYSPECFSIKPGERRRIPLGFAIELEDETCAMIQGKSGLANRYGIDTIGNIIDCGYIGECHAILVNHGDNTVTFMEGDKIAQMIIFKIAPTVGFKQVKKLNDTPRGDGGFGSTGK